MIDARHHVRDLADLADLAGITGTASERDAIFATTAIRWYGLSCAQ